MRVLLIGDLCYTHMRRWAVGLAQLGVNVTVLSETETELPGIRIIPSVVPPWRVWRPRRWIARWRSVFRRSITQTQFDLIHLHYPHPYSIFLEDIENYPLVISTWGSEIIPMDQEPESHKAMKVAYLRHAKRVIALSDFLADATAKYAGIDRRDIVRHYWGVDLKHFSPDAEPCSQPVIGFAKALSRQYGSEYVIDALPRILQIIPSARVLMLGDGELETSVKERAHRLGVYKAIEWIGHVDHSQMPRYYARMALSVMPSVYPSETLGLAALESQAMCVPVVASRIGGIPESVIDGETGLLAPPRDARSLADAILTLLLDTDLRLRLGQQGRAHVERQFDWRSTLNNMFALYREVIRPKSEILQNTV